MAITTAGWKSADFGSPFEKIMPYVARGNSANTASLTQQLFVCPDDTDPHGKTISGCFGNPTTPLPGITSYLHQRLLPVRAVQTRRLEPRPIRSMWWSATGSSATFTFIPGSAKFTTRQGTRGQSRERPLFRPASAGTARLTACSRPPATGTGTGRIICLRTVMSNWSGTRQTIQPAPNQQCFGQYQALPDAPGP